MEILLLNNPLRIVPGHFMYIHCIGNEGAFNKDVFYTVSHEKYGNVGQAQLVISFEKYLYDLPETAQFIAEGDNKVKDRYRAKGYSQMAKFQVCTFRMSRHYQAIAELIMKETAAKGIEIHKKTSLFEY